MQTLMLPATCSGAAPPPRRPLRTEAQFKSLWVNSVRPFTSISSANDPPYSSLSPSKLLTLSSPYVFLNNRRQKNLAPCRISASNSSPSDASEKAKLAQVARRLENTSRNFKRLGSFGFWGQLVCTVVAAVILSFSIIITGKITSPATFYATAGGIAAAFVSVFWSFGHIRLADKLRRTASDPSKAPPRAEVVKSLKNGIVVNLLGMGSAILGMQATVGLLVAKALTTSATPYYQGMPPGNSPVLALDVFLVQASANTILSHFLGLACSLELLRSVTLPSTEGSVAAVPKLA
ncbi:protein TIC 21, chloroplastic [Andrographis paniculata]|uniref:protein TIC 21, chloroplastic n=1 Tax=Andrographis paniculata TaxID=175694 RepID=UPI0021E8A8B3|nr:protein TIC 21, chloroplastic [Andrographis paniculata]